MKNIYNAVKQTARKYALPAIITGSVALNSCEKKINEYNLPIEHIKIENLVSEKICINGHGPITNLDSIVNFYEEQGKILEREKTKSQLVKELTNYENNLNSEADLLNKMLKTDQYWDVNEMEELYIFYKDSKLKLKKIGSLATELNDSNYMNISLPEQYEDLGYLLKKNLEGKDFDDMPTIESVLKSKGYNIKCEGACSKTEIREHFMPLSIVGIGAIFGGFCVVGSLIGMNLRRLKNEKSTERTGLIYAYPIKNIRTIYTYCDGENKYHETCSGKINPHKKGDIFILKSDRKTLEEKTIREGAYKIYKIRSLSEENARFATAYMLRRQNEKKFFIRNSLEKFLGKF